MKVTHGDPQYLVLYDEQGAALATCVSIEARDRLIEAVNGGVGVTDPESDRLVDELFADARAAAAEARVRELENRFCESHRGHVKASHDCAYCGLYIDTRAEGGE